MIYDGNVAYVLFRCDGERIIIECNANMIQCDGERVIECSANMIRNVNGPIAKYVLSLLHSL